MQNAEKVSGNGVIHLTGEIDLASADGVALLLRPMVEAGGPVVVDLSNVTFMDTTGSMSWFVPPTTWPSMDA